MHFFQKDATLAISLLAEMLAMSKDFVMYSKLYENCFDHFLLMSRISECLNIMNTSKNYIGLKVVKRR